MRIPLVLAFAFFATLALAFADDRPTMTPKRTDVKPFEYVPANVPFYPPGKKWGVIGDGIKQMQKPLDPAESMKHYVHPAGFELRLFADESLLGGKPICDELGRARPARGSPSPSITRTTCNPRARATTRSSSCEDTDGDGRADKVTVFADKLSIPTSLTFAHGGVIVHQPPHTLFLKDTDGDGKADVRRCCSPAGARATRTPGRATCGTASTTGFTAWCGYSGFDGTVGGERIRSSQGFFRFKPDGSEARIPPQHDEQLLGRRLQRGRAAVRLDGQRLPERVPGRSRTATTRRSAAGRPACCR